MKNNKYDNKLCYDKINFEIRSIHGSFNCKFLKYIDNIPIYIEFLEKLNYLRPFTGYIGLYIKLTKYMRNKIIDFLINLNLKTIANAFQEIEDNEIIYIIMSEDDMNIDILTDIKISSELSHKNDIDNSYLLDNIYMSCKKLHNYFEIINPNPFKKSIFGIKDKNKLKCRFCGKDINNTTFKHKSHTISEALGNKTLFTCDECDLCNEQFGKSVEKTLIEYIDPLRTLFGVKGKNNKIPNMKCNNIEFKNIKSSENQLLMKIHPKSFIENNKIKFKRDVIHMDRMKFQEDIYKCLTKYALGIIDNKYLKYFEKTINWISGNYNASFLPKLAFKNIEIQDHSPFSICLFIRKKSNNIFPYAVCEFRFTNKLFFYIVPTFDLNEKRFVFNSQYNIMFKYFHANLASKWYFWDFMKNYI